MEFLICGKTWEEIQAMQNGTYRAKPLSGIPKPPIMPETVTDETKKTAQYGEEYIDRESERINLVAVDSTGRICAKIVLQSAKRYNTITDAIENGYSIITSVNREKKKPLNLGNSTFVYKLPINSGIGLDGVLAGLVWRLQPEERKYSQ